MQKFINHWQTATSEHLTAAGSTLYVPGAAAALLSFAGGGWYKLTLVNDSRTAWEILTATARAGGAITVTRGAEATAIQEWPPGSTVFIELTAASMNGVLEQLSTLAASYTALSARVQALEEAEPEPEPEPGGETPGSGTVLTDGAGDRLIDQNSNRLIVGE